MSWKTSQRLHTAGLTSSPKHPWTTAGHVFMSVGPISTKKHRRHNARSAAFLPPSATSTSFSATENQPVLLKQSICFRPFCSSRATKRHDCMGKSSLEQLTSHSFRGRTNPKGYVTKVFLKSSVGCIWHNIQEKAHEDIIVLQLIKHLPQRDEGVIWRMEQSFCLTEVPGIQSFGFAICLFCHFLYYALLE